MWHFTCLLIFLVTVYVAGNDGVTTKPNVLQRKHFTLDTCAQACLLEKEIKCKYFKFLNTTGTCYLSAEDYPDFSDYDKHASKDASTTSLPTAAPTPTITTPKGSNLNKTGVNLLQKNETNQTNLSKLKNVTARLQELKKVEDRLFEENMKATNDLSKKVGAERSSLHTHSQLLQILMDRTLKLNEDFKELQLNQSKMEQKLNKATINDNNLWQRVTSLAKADAMAVEQEKKYAKLLWKSVEDQQNLRNDVEKESIMLEKQNEKQSQIKSDLAATMAATALKVKEEDQKVDQIKKSLASVSKDSTHFEGNVEKEIEALKASMNALKKMVVMIAARVANWNVLQEYPSIREQEEATVQRKKIEHQIGLLSRNMAEIERKTKEHDRELGVMRKWTSPDVSLEKNMNKQQNQNQISEHDAFRKLSVEIIELKKENEKLNELLKQCISTRKENVEMKNHESRGNKTSPLIRKQEKKDHVIKKGAQKRSIINAGSRKAKLAKGTLKRPKLKTRSRKGGPIKDSRLQSGKTNEKKRVKKDVTSCPPLFTASTAGKYCFLTPTMQLTFNDAKMYCNKYKGKLTTIDTKEKETAVQTFLSRNRIGSSYVWLSRVIIDDSMLVWKESHKPLSNYHNFKEGRAPIGASCILLDTSTGQWISRPCPEKNDEVTVLHSAICEPYVPLQNDYKTIGADKREHTNANFTKVTHVSSSGFGNNVQIYGKRNLDLVRPHQSPGTFYK